MEGNNADITKGFRDWYIHLKLGLLRDYRIVKMADAQGNVREGIFIPFVQNGIRWDGVKYKYPSLFLKPTFVPRNGRLIHKLLPMVTEEFRKKMINEGVLSPDDKIACDYIGEVLRDRDKM